MTAPLPPVTVALTPAIWTVLSADLDAVRSCLGAMVDAQLRIMLGPDQVFAAAAVEVRAAPSEQAGPARVQIGDRDCDIAAQTLWDALAYARGQADTAGSEADLASTAVDSVVEAVTEFVRVAVTAHAAHFVPDNPPRQAALDLGVALSGAGEPAGRTLDDLLNAYVAPTVEIVVEPSFIRRLAEDRDAQLFPFLRGSLLVELGLRFPRFVLRTDSTLRTSGFYFVVNGVAATPRIGPPAGTLLVNDTVERLALAGYTATATSNPANAKPASFVADVERAELNADGRTTWNPAEYLILSLAAILRTAAPGLVTLAAVEAMLTELAATDPELVGAAREELSVVNIASSLRALLRDGVSVRNFSRIVELMLRHHQLCDDQRPADRIAFVRGGLSDAIASVLGRGSVTVVAYLLSPELERAVLATHPLPADTARTVVAAVADEIAMLPPTALTPAVLTDEAVRPVLADLLRRPFPQLRVISYGDLPGSVNVQPVARISVPA